MTCDMLRVDLATPSTGKGSDLVAFPDTLATAYLKTVSDIINGERVGLDRFIDPTKKAAIRAGTSADDISANLTTAFASGAKHLYARQGLYRCKVVVIPSGLTLEGAGKNTIFQGIDLGDSQVIFGNANGSAYTDSNITLQNLVIDGNNAGSGPTQTRTVELIGFARLTSLKLLGVTVQNANYIGLATAACKDVLIDGCTFTNLGFAGVGTGNGPALAILGVGTPADQNEDVRVVNSWITANRWTGLQITGKRLLVANNNFLNNRENHIYAIRGTPNTECLDLIIQNNVFHGVIRQQISSHAIETNAARLKIIGNNIRDCDHGGIALTNVLYAEVVGNMCGNYAKLSGGHAFVDIRTEVYGSIQHIKIAHNMVYDDQGTMTAGAAVNINKAGSGTVVQHVSIEDNDFDGPTYTSGRAINIEAGVWGTGCVRRGNKGSPDLDPVTLTFTPSGGTGNKSFTGFGYKPRRLRIEAMYGGTYMQQSVCDLNTNGACKLVITSADGTAGLAQIVAGTNIWDVRTVAGVSQAVAGIVSFDDDGFTASVTTATVVPSIKVTAYP